MALVTLRVLQRSMHAGGLQLRVGCSAATVTARVLKDRRMTFMRGSFGKDQKLHYASPTSHSGLDDGVDTFDIQIPELTILSNALRSKQ